MKNLDIYNFNFMMNANIINKYKIDKSRLSL